MLIVDPTIHMIGTGRHVTPSTIAMVRPSPTDMRHHRHAMPMIATRPCHGIIKV